MNFRLVLHLIRTDWLRLRKPLIGLWLIVAITAVPWLLHDPRSFQAPSWFFDTASQYAQPFTGVLWKGALWRKCLIHLELAGAILQIIIAAALGMQSHDWLRVSPLRKRERLAAKTLVLAGFIVAPQVVMILANLLLHELPIGRAFAAAASHGVSSMLLLGAAAAFASWCPSLWQCLAGAAAVTVGQAFLMMLIPERLKSLLPAIPGYLWTPPMAVQTWIFLAATIVLLGGLLGRWRSRLSLPARIAVAVSVLMTTAGVMPPHAGVRAATAMTSPATEPFTGIQPEPNGQVTLKAPGIQKLEQNPAISYELSGPVKTEGTPTGVFVTWQAGERGVVSQDGTVLATRLAAPRTSPDSPFPSRDSALELAALTDALPGKRQPFGVPYAPQDFEAFTRFGDFQSTGRHPSHEGGLVMLEADLTAIVFRYERVIDVPLSDATVEIRDGDTVYRFKRFAPQTADVWADLSVTYPLERESWSPPPVERCRFFLHLPENNVNVSIQSLFHQTGPLLSGAGWHRTILGRPEERIQQMDPSLRMEGARLIMLKPVVLGRLPVRPFRAPVSPIDEKTRRLDFTSTRSNYGVDADDYQRAFLPQRPDPRSCSRAEFGRWLRIPAATHQASNLAAHDLAEFAPRFPDLLAKVAYLDNVAEALRLGLPESSRHALLSQIDNVPNPGPVIGTLARRGWAGEAEDVLARRYLDGAVDGSHLDDIIALEHPDTYPALVQGLIRQPSLQTYERIRLLPGIKPTLDKAIAEALEKADHARLIVLADRHDSRFPFGPYLIPAKDGNAHAFAALLSLIGKEATLYQTDNLANLIAAPNLQGNLNLAWRDYLRGKSAANFRYDALSRRWLPL